MEFPLGDGGGVGGTERYIPFFCRYQYDFQVARHLVMKNKNWNLLQLEMGKYFQRIITIFIYNCERFEPRSHFIITFTRTIILSLLKNIYILIVYLGISSFFWR